MRRIWIIFRKEALDTLRDRRTLMIMVGMPLLLIPLLLLAVTRIQSAQFEKAERQQQRIAFFGIEYAPELYARFEADERLLLINGIEEDSLVNMITSEELAGAVLVAPDFLIRIAGDQQAQVQIIFQGSDAFGTAKDRLIDLIEAYDREIVNERVKRLKLDPNLFDAIKIEQTDLATMQEKIAEAVGGFLPYMFIIFGFMGAMYPGIDLGAGEKERGTLETLLSTPAARLEIVIGKLLVVMAAGVATALLALLGIFLAMHSFPEMPAHILDVITDMLGLRMVFFLFTLILPLTAFFAAVILSLSIYARSFKEAQSIITPLNIAIIFPAMIGLLPGIELNATTALVPILNVALATKDLLAGSINPFYLAEVYVSLLVLAGVSIWGCVIWFNREATLFRS
ncbi:MAG: ABC transporter permease [Candidatus Marinimicrobia bacterium]|nr:ABC transporter permease [Candidatus Neomarinimicrobiota bacterium]